MPSFWGSVGRIANFRAFSTIYGDTPFKCGQIGQDPHVQIRALMAANVDECGHAEDGRERIVAVPRVVEIFAGCCRAAVKKRCWVALSEKLVVAALYMILRYETQTVNPGVARAVEGNRGGWGDKWADGGEVEAT